MPSPWTACGFESHRTQKHKSTNELASRENVEASGESPRSTSRLHRSPSVCVRRTVIAQISETLPNFANQFLWSRIIGRFSCFFLHILTPHEPNEVFYRRFSADSHKSGINSSLGFVNDIIARN